MTERKSKAKEANETEAKPVTPPEPEERAYTFWDERKVYDIARDDTLLVDVTLGHQLASAVEEGLQLGQAPTSPHSRFTIHPTEVTHCLRRAILQRHYGRRPMPPNVLIQARLGDAAHETVQSSLKAAGIRILHEVRFEDTEMGVTMRMDGVAYRAECEGVQYILEIKSVAGWGQKRIQENGLPRASDIIQLEYYMHVAKAGLGVLMYVSRDTGEISTFMLKSDPILQDYILGRIAKLKECDETHVIIERPYPRGDWKCQARYCEMAEICNKLPATGGPMDCIERKENGDER